MNKSTLQINMSPGISNKDGSLNEAMICEKPKQHTNRENKLKVRSFKKKAMGGV